MEKPFKITFLKDATADAIHIHAPTEVSHVLQELGLQRGQPVLVVIGGASQLSEADFIRVQQLFVEVLAPLAQQWNASVVDGGTDAGVMRLMGQARAATQTTFPLIGICPVGLATLPHVALASEDAALLEPHHTHFILVPGNNWGDESGWIAHIASELADTAPSVTVLINGGEVTWKDASQNVEEGRSILVIAGSGRTADKLAAVLRGETTDQRAQELVESGLVQAIDLTTCAEVLPKTIEKIFSSREQ
jgi:SLOG in TRPM, prokaryote